MIIAMQAVKKIRVVVFVYVLFLCFVFAIVLSPDRFLSAEIHYVELYINLLIRIFILFFFSTHHAIILKRNYSSYVTHLSVRNYEGYQDI